MTALEQKIKNDKNLNLKIEIRKLVFPTQEELDSMEWDRLQASNVKNGAIVSHKSLNFDKLI